ncbi:hypothetical protein ACFP2T_22025 [Plantactinospora solaniradicis]|uniref:Helix-turn-helix domain-containing protein n=1 Tax=Plantactinospora solaniradicis TaxID=1723736 RepID=A0ABW1KC83_9ACTN
MPQHSRPVTDADRKRVRELHANGLSRNAIAKEINRSGRWVSRIADELGLDFERTRARAATIAKVVDARTRRAALALALLDDVDELRARLHVQYEVHAFGKEGSLNTGSVTKPPPATSEI